MSTSYSDPTATEVVVAPASPLGGAFVRVSWSAIFAGIVLVLAIEILLDALGAGVGFGLINPGESGTPSASSLGTGAGIWWLVSAIVALLFGSYAAARLAGVPRRWDGALHGLVIWAGVALVTVYLLTIAIGGAFSLLGGTLSAAGSVIGGAASTAGHAAKVAVPQVQQATGITPNLLQQQAEGILTAPTPENPASMSHADAVKAIGQALPDLLSGGDKAAAAKNRITDIVAAQAHISPQEARKRVDDIQARLTNLKNQAAETAARAARATTAAASHASFMAFVALLVCAIAAAIGGALASPRPRVRVPPAAARGY